MQQQNTPKNYFLDPAKKPTKIQLSPDVRARDLTEYIRNSKQFKEMHHSARSYRYRNSTQKNGGILNRTQSF